jgi:hypothetical protein
MCPILSNNISLKQTKSSKHVIVEHVNLSPSHLKAEVSAGRRRTRKAWQAVEPHLQCELRLTHQSKGANTHLPSPTNPTTRNTHTLKMAVKPITGMLRRGLVLDLSVAFGMPLFARARPPEPPGGCERSE